MTTNEVQYRATKAHASRFEEALRNLEADKAARNKRRALEIGAVRAQLEDLQGELTEYEQLRSRNDPDPSKSRRFPNWP